jgi:hypothetical protein
MIHKSSKKLVFLGITCLLLLLNLARALFILINDNSIYSGPYDAISPLVHQELVYQVVCLLNVLCAFVCELNHLIIE